MLNREEIQKHLIKNTDIFIYDITDSTNTQAKAKLREGLSCDALFLAESQSGGRGRQGKSFYSPKGTGLYMSLALQGDSCPKSLLVTSAAAVLVSQAIEEVCHRSVSIKWVNDLYIDDKKICGILTEAVRDVSGELLGMVIGVGVNVTTQSFPDDIKDIAASLGTAVDRNHLAAAIANKLISASFDDENILAEYKKRSMVIGRNIIYYINNIPHQGIAVDIDNDGGLVVKSGNEAVVLNSGEITLRLN